jgi:hypothetical protein
MQMSVSRRETSEETSGHFGRSTQSSREVIVAWLGITAGVVLLFGFSQTEAPAHADEPGETRAAAEVTREELTWVHRLHAAPAGQTRPAMDFEFLNRSGKMLAHVEVVVRETDSLNRLIRDHHETAENLSAGQGWIFKIYPSNAGSTLAISDVRLN